MKFAVPFLHLGNLETYFQMACIMGVGFYLTRCYSTIFNIIVKTVSKWLRTEATKSVKPGQTENNPCSPGWYTRYDLMTSSLISKTIYQNISPLRNPKRLLQKAIWVYFKQNHCWEMLPTSGDLSHTTKGN